MRTHSFDAAHVEEDHSVLLAQLGTRRLVSGPQPAAHGPRQSRAIQMQQRGSMHRHYLALKQSEKTR